MSCWHIPLPNMKQAGHGSTFHSFCVASQVGDFDFWTSNKFNLQQCFGQTPEDLHPQERCEMCGATVLRPHRNHTSNSPVDLLTPKVLPSCSKLCFDRAKLLCSIVPCRTSRLNCNSSRWPGIELKGSRSHRFAILVSSHSGFHCVPAPRVTGCHSFAPSRAVARWGGAARSPKKTPVNSVVAAPRMQKGLLICCVLAVQKQWVQYQMRKIGVEGCLAKVSYGVMPEPPLFFLPYPFAFLSVATVKRVA